MKLLLLCVATLLACAYAQPLDIELKLWTTTTSCQGDPAVSRLTAPVSTCANLDFAGLTTSGTFWCYTVNNTYDATFCADALCGNPANCVRYQGASNTCAQLGDTGSFVINCNPRGSPSPTVTPSPAQPTPSPSDAATTTVLSVLAMVFLVGITMLASA